MTGTAMILDHIGFQVGDLAQLHAAARAARTTAPRACGRNTIRTTTAPS